MFKGVVDKNLISNLSLGMTTLRWVTEVKVRTLPINWLIATQPGVLFAPLLVFIQPIGGDPYPHVIFYNGDYYLEDGHHRVMKSILSGLTTIDCRVLYV